jgi:hypothetical protein
MRALEKDRTRRYESAAALAQDIQRHLQDEPVTAAPPSVAYRFGKFARRHRGMVGGAALLGILLINATTISTIFALRAYRAENRAREEATLANAISVFLNKDLLGTADPDRVPEPDLTMRVLLDRAADQVQPRLEGRPLAEAATRMTIGQLYGRLGAHDKAATHFTRAHEIYLRELGEEHPRSIETLGHLAANAYARSQPELARQLSYRALDTFLRTQGDQHRDWVRHLTRHADICSGCGDHEAAFLFARDAVAAAEQIPDVDPNEYARALMIYGQNLGSRGSRDDGET